MITRRDCLTQIATAALGGLSIRDTTGPAGTIKAGDIARARENLRRYQWARDYRDLVERECRSWVDKITPAFLAQMIPATTPGATNFTPCPACRDQGKPVHPHGQWQWSPREPDRLVCAVCTTRFPSDAYAESVTLTARHGGEQTFSFYGGAPFALFSYPTGRPSFSGNIRARRVDFMASLCRSLAEAYTLTGNPGYADAARRILLRFAQVYPRWLVHVGYGEIADLDPRVAAQKITQLPVDELAAPPTAPDRKLHTGYWTAGRATASGQEGNWLRRVTEAYDLTRAAYTAAERRVIENNLLLEGTILLMADPAVNNKSVGNTTTLALIGLVTQRPDLVRRGLNAFRETVDHWFLADGSTSESWSYALMTLNGIHSLAQALRGHADDLYQSSYQRVWEAMFRGLQGDLRYPALADGHVKEGIGARYAELMAASYPQNQQYFSLLRTIAGNDLANGYAPYAIYYREPGREKTPAPPLALPDHLFPALQVGYLRGGKTGRDSALVLSASNWGIHHHRDSLSLYWWQDGQTLLSDLGYLWDHPQRSMTTRTLAHNTVLVDGAEQAAQNRGGRFTLFAAGPTIKVMEAESSAYAQTTLYRRTVVQIEGAPGEQRCVVDFFRVRGGATHDYVFHGPHKDLHIDGPPLRAWPEGVYDLQSVQGTEASGARTLSWQLPSGGAPPRGFHALWPGEAGETFLVGQGWGQRDYKNSDVGATLPYVVRRRTAGSGGAPLASVFVGAFEATSLGADGGVRSIRRLPMPEGEANNAVAVAVDTDRGTDYVVSCFVARPVTIVTPNGRLEMTARLGVVRTTMAGMAQNGFVTGGAPLRWQGKEVNVERNTV